MTSHAALEAFFATNPDAIACELTSVRGSSPRAEGTFMLVSLDAILGTIGGGALEYMVIDHARRLISEGRAEAAMDVPLGPEIGQCCGGRVKVSLRYADVKLRSELAARIAHDDASACNVYIFGAGHVGRVLAQILSLLPVKLEVIDTRQEELDSLAPGIPNRRVAMPEAVVRAAPMGSAFVILTHDHALDFLIANEALARADSPYVGMVGSRTKRAKFASWYLEQGGDPSALERLVLPIGAQGLGDKRPSVIAALAAAEIMVQIGKREVLIGHVSTPSNEGVASGF
ncbi:xanthine dehydrogenase accessory protein XdhC [Devosia sp. XJ19-1]|uniref:Xanthine dehydrogenase accessory protein XdhC n=1 Tax=Devosia ureilytica TaxID=2952754 RepID=A0A9Q4APH8_9HYPH|nr:xanthine dehydrogenase accessory protein XdhC [Devosia ureilytica]MCP8883956.1 xanthine dehydrogenase accessory protein XdhC [Devosia ureilytica]MCP8887564.1 xanthine dehydrogenase accessory protein XdhC [Devosia ureilytica]